MKEFLLNENKKNFITNARVSLDKLFDRILNNRKFKYFLECLLINDLIHLMGLIKKIFFEC